jgi:hypothetical protein
MLDAAPDPERIVDQALGGVEAALERREARVVDEEAPGAPRMGRRAGECRGERALAAGCIYIAEREEVAAHVEHGDERRVSRTRRSRRLGRLAPERFALGEVVRPGEQDVQGICVLRGRIAGAARSARRAAHRRRPSRAATRFG